MVEVCLSKRDAFSTDGSVELFTVLKLVEVAEFVNIRAVGFHICLTEELGELTFAFLLLLALFSSQDGLNLVLGLSGSYELKPFTLHLRLLGGKDFYLIATAKDVVEGDKRVVDLGADAVGSHKGVDGECEVEGSTANGHLLGIALGRHDEELVGVEVELDGVEEVHTARLWVVEDFLDGLKPLVEFAFTFLGGLFTIFVFPVGGKALFGNFVHALATNLNFYPLADFLVHERGVDGLVAIALGMADPVAEAVGMGGVEFRDVGIDLHTFGFFLGWVAWLEDDANGKNVVNVFKGDMLGLHLFPDGIRPFYACLNGVLDAVLVKYGADGTNEVRVDGGKVTFHLGQTLLDEFALLRMFVTEAEILEFFLYLVQS